MENKIVQVHRVATEGKTKVLANTYINETHKTNPFISGSLYDVLMGLPIEAVEQRGYKYQHLHFTSDEVAQEGDWYLFKGKIIGLADKRHGELGRLTGHKKIIATTDKKMTIETSATGYTEDRARTFYGTEPLPQIPQSFVKHYAEQGGIDSVELGYDCLASAGLIIMDISKDPPEDDLNIPTECYKWTLKLTSDNEVIVHLIEEKMYSLNEIRNIHVAVTKQGCLYEGGDWSDKHKTLVESEFNRYIKDNL